MLKGLVSLMAISLSKKRNVAKFVAQLDAAYGKQLSNRLRDIQSAELSLSNARKILKALCEVLPLDLGAWYDLPSYGGDVTIEVSRAQATRVIKRMREAGYVFKDAQYTLASQDELGNDRVNVSRGIESVTGYVAAPESVGRLFIQWIAPYRGGSKCKIVEHTSAAYTSRSLVCESPAKVV